MTEGQKLLLFVVVFIIAMAVGGWADSLTVEMMQE